jgi:FkbM family methyltransferase
MIHRILQQDLFKQRPPVLVDVGASGGIHSRWSKIARYAFCIAFDADDREMKITEDSSAGFRKLITINRIVTDRDESEIDFFLTASPYCSSTLEPDMMALAAWPFQSLFALEKKVRLKAVRLAEALREVGITRVDWLKIDTQGTDLRIYRSLPTEMQRQVLVAEMEPGILDAYKGEDKLHEVMRHMQDGFFMASMEVKGVARIEVGKKIRESAWGQRALRAALRTTPGWAEITYMNLLRDEKESRSFQLLYVFALLERHFGFAREIARRGKEVTGEPIFGEMETYAEKRISRIRYQWPFFALRNRLNRAFEAIFF